MGDRTAPIRSGGEGYLQLPVAGCCDKVSRCGWFLRRDAQGAIGKGDAVVGGREPCRRNSVGAGVDGALCGAPVGQRPAQRSFVFIRDEALIGDPVAAAEGLSVERLGCVLGRDGQRNGLDGTTDRVVRWGGVTAGVRTGEGVLHGDGLVGAGLRIAVGSSSHNLNVGAGGKGNQGAGHHGRCGAAIVGLAQRQLRLVDQQLYGCGREDFALRIHKSLQRSVVVERVGAFKRIGHCDGFARAHSGIIVQRAGKHRDLVAGNQPDQAAGLHGRVSGAVIGFSKDDSRRGDVQRFSADLPVGEGFPFRRGVVGGGRALQGVGQGDGLVGAGKLIRIGGIGLYGDQILVHGAGYGAQAHRCLRRAVVGFDLSHGGTGNRQRFGFD